MDNVDDAVSTLYSEPEKVETPKVTVASTKNTSRRKTDEKEIISVIMCSCSWYILCL